MKKWHLVKFSPARAGLVILWHINFLGIRKLTNYLPLKH
jgi:hypothetical protein